MHRLTGSTRLQLFFRESLKPLLFLLLFSLQYLLWLAPGGVLSALRLHQSVNEQLTENALYQQENTELMAKIDAWKHDHKIIEARARKEFGMIKQGETFYQW